jgi:DNA-dependent RNA polymerase auxiliary subunit epsilon
MEQTPKEKAIELVNNFRHNVLDYEGSGLNQFKAKQCALIAVDLAIQYNDFHIEFLQKVKQEIENF